MCGGRGGHTVDEGEDGRRGGEVRGETEVRVLGGHDGEEAAADSGRVGEGTVAVGAGGVGHCGVCGVWGVWGRMILAERGISSE